MTFLSSLAGWQWAVLACVPVGIVLLYFLKLRRQPVTVPSTYLWKRTIEDLHVNSLLQRLRVNPLLLLQLLAVALAALALLRPGYHDSAATNSRRIFLLDGSASMQAIDDGQGTSRFEMAKRLILQEIDAMTDEDVAMLMLLSDRTDVLQAFTSDRRRLREALSAARVTNRSTNIQSALRAADGLATRRPGNNGSDDDTVKDENPIELVVYSDGAFTAVPEFDTTRLSPRYVRVGSDQPTNLAIVAFSAQRSESAEGQVDLFATIANLGTAPASSAVSLRLNNDLVDADQVALEPGDEVGLSFQIADESIMRLKLSLDEMDALAVDNDAYAVLAPNRTISVLMITPGNKALELALSTGEAEKVCVLETVPISYLQSDTYKTRAATGVDELIIYDRCAPDSMPMTNTFFIGRTPPEGWKANDVSSQVLLIDIDRSHPIMRYLDLFSLLIAEGRSITGPAGTTNLLSAENGAVLAIAPRAGFQDLVLGFEIISESEDGGMAFNTDWQVQRSWPVFVLNTLRYLTGAAESGVKVAHPPGSNLTLSTDRRQGELSVRTPRGEVDFVRPDESGRVRYAVHDQLGVYEIEDEKKIVDLFAVSLLDRQESRVAAASSVQLGMDQVTNDVKTVDTRREYWRWLLLCMVGLLSIEWWYYGRRLQ